MMKSIEKEIILIYAVFSLLVFIMGVNEAVRKKNPFKLSKHLSWMGIFVWGDAVILGPFWLMASLLVLLLNDWLLFLVIISVFWTVRSVGETIYWLNQQFSSVNRNPPATLTGYRFFKNDSIWFIYQLFSQCVTIISLISTIYFSYRWLVSLQ